MTTRATVIVSAAVAIASNSFAPAGAPSDTALRLDGATGYLAGNHTIGLDAMTVEGWVRVDSLTFGPSNGGGLVTSGAGASQNFSVWLFVDGSTPAEDWRPGFQVNWANGTSSIVSVPAGSGYLYDEWHHIAASFDGVTAIVYVDGLEIVRDDFASPINWISPATVTIGNEFPGVSEKIGGDLDEIRIWSRVRSAAEIADTYDRALCPDEPDLWARYDFESASGTDATGQGHDLGPVGGVAWVVSDAPILAGDCVHCPADTDGNGTVDLADLLAVLAGWGPCSGACAGDVSGDGVVGFDDLISVLGAWGACPAAP